MIIKENKKRFYTFFGLIILCFTLLLFLLPNLNSKKIKIQIHNINEWITGFDLGYSSLNNITHDGTKKFQNEYNQTISSKLASLLINTPNILISNSKLILYFSFTLFFIISIKLRISLDLAFP